MRLIDADALPIVTECCVDEAGFFAKFKVVHEEDIQNAPTIEARPVVRGEWELYGDDDDLSASYFCSICGYNMDEDEYLDSFSSYKFCPNCGADMRGDANAL